MEIERQRISVRVQSKDIICEKRNRIESGRAKKREVGSYDLWDISK